MNYKWKIEKLRKTKDEMTSPHTKLYWKFKLVSSSKKQNQLQET